MFAENSSDSLAQPHCYEWRYAGVPIPHWVGAEPQRWVSQGESSVQQRESWWSPPLEPSGLSPSHWTSSQATLWCTCTNCQFISKSSSATLWVYRGAIREEFMESENPGWSWLSSRIAPHTLGDCLHCFTAYLYKEILYSTVPLLPVPLPCKVYVNKTVCKPKVQ
jgi:hypothetical protein